MASLTLAKGAFTWYRLLPVTCTFVVVYLSEPGAKLSIAETEMAIGVPPSSFVVINLFMTFFPRVPLSGGKESLVVSEALTQLRRRLAKVEVVTTTVLADAAFAIAARVVVLFPTGGVIPSLHVK